MLHNVPSRSATNQLYDAIGNGLVLERNIELFLKALMQVRSRLRFANGQGPDLEDLVVLLGHRRQISDDDFMEIDEPLARLIQAFAQKLPEPDQKRAFFDQVLRKDSRIKPKSALYERVLRISWNANN